MLDGKQVVISDIVMHGMSGLEMIPQVLQRSPDTVVLMISGENDLIASSCGKPSCPMDGNVKSPCPFWSTVLPICRAKIAVKAFIW